MARNSQSLMILKEDGPMTLRKLTQATAQRMQVVLMYEDVAAVMQSHLNEGLVEVEDALDYRDKIWKAI
jgi:hypothetical protein